jgi:putative GTP pyrophosphokinase
MPLDLPKMLLGEKEYGQRKVRNEDHLIESLIAADFLEMVRKNMEPWRQLMTYYRCAMMEVETKFRVLNEQFSLQYDRNPIESIRTRMKSIESIAGKMRRKNIPFTLESLEENIFDVAGVRIVCSFPEDIYMLGTCLLQQDDVRLMEKRDYIEHPKKSGYRSLHLIVEVPIFLQNEKRLMKVEVQLRTIAMDFWASLEHKIRYKKDIDPAIAGDLAREMLECAEISAALDHRMEQVRNRLEEEQTRVDGKLRAAGADSRIPGPQIDKSILDEIRRGIL